MNITVIGATGNIGSRFVAQAAAAGHHVTAYARRPDAVIARAGVAVAGGELTDGAALAQAITDSDVVVVLLTGSMTDGSFMKRTFPPVLAALRATPRARLVLVSVFGAQPTRPRASMFARAVYSTVLRRFLADKAESDTAALAAHPRTTIVFPVNLVDRPASGDGAVFALDDVATVPGMPTLSLDDAADALLSVVTSSDAPQRVVIAPREAVRTRS